MDLACLGAEEFNEAFLDLRIALFELVGVCRKQLQVFELGFVRWVGDFGMTRIQAFVVRQQLLVKINSVKSFAAFGWGASLAMATGDTTKGIPSLG